MMLIFDEQQGSLHSRISEEPRFSTSQRDAMLQIVKLDHRACIKGFDQKMRPWIRYKGKQGKPVEYSLLRNGDAAKPVKPLYETW